MPACTLFDEAKKRYGAVALVILDSLKSNFAKKNKSKNCLL